METIRERLLKWVAYNHYKPATIEKKCGMSNGSLKRTINHSDETLEKIRSNYPNFDWQYVKNGLDPDEKYIYLGGKFDVKEDNAQLREDLKNALEENKKLAKRIEQLEKERPSFLKTIERLTSVLCGEKPDIKELDKSLLK